jgi:hypothetical protein
MYFDDGTNPTMEIVREFIDLSERVIEGGGAFCFLLPCLLLLLVGELVALLPLGRADELFFPHRRRELTLLLRNEQVPSPFIAKPVLVVPVRSSEPT